MTAYFKKAAVLIAAMLITVSAASCGSSDKKTAGAHQDHNIAGTVPQGVAVGEDVLADSTERELSPDEDDVPLDIIFYPAYTTDDEAKVISNYFCSLSDKSVEKLESSVYPDELKFKLDSSSSQEFLDTEHDYLIETLTEEDFEFIGVTVEELLPSDDEAYSYYNGILGQAAPDANVTVRKVFKINCLYTKEGGGQYSLALRMEEKQMGDIIIAVYTIDGKPYILF